MKPIVSWRYHAASLVAVFLALAIGVGIGGLVLHGTVVSDLHRQVREANDQKRSAQKAAVNGVADEAEGQRLVDQLGNALLPSRLAGRAVMIVSAPGVPDAVRRPLALGIASAGATVVGDLRLSPAFVDPAQEGALSDLAVRLVPPGVTLPTDPLGAAATVLAAVTSGAAPAGSAVNVLAATKSAGFTAMGTRSDAPAGLVLVIGVPGAGSSPALTPAVAGAFAARGASVVVTSAGQVGTAISSIRNDKSLVRSVSTVDRADALGSALRVVLTLSARAKGVIGHYGGPAQSAAVPPM